MKHFDALLQRIETSLFIKLQAERREFLFDNLPTIPEKFFVRIYQYHIVHITHVIFDFEPLLDIVIQIIKDRESNELRYLGTESDSYVSETLYNFARPESYFRILHPLADCFFCDVVPYTLEIVMNIAFQHPAFRTESLPVFPEMCRDPVQRVIHASPSHTGAIIRNKRFCDLLV